MSDDYHKYEGGDDIGGLCCCFSGGGGGAEDDSSLMWCYRNNAETDDAGKKPLDKDQVARAK